MRLSSIDSRMPFSARDPADEREVVAGLARERHRLQRQAVVDRGDPVLVGEPPALALADRDERDAAVDLEQLRQAGRVEAAVEGRDDRRLAVLGEHERVVLHVRVDDVEAVRLAPRDLDRVLHVRRDVAREARRPQALRDGGDQLVGDVRVASARRA